MNDRQQLYPFGDAEGRVSSAWAWTTAMTSGRAAKIAAWMIEAAVLLVHRLTIEIELDDFFGAHQLRGARMSDQGMLGIVGVTDADMAVGVDDLLSYPASPLAPGGPPL